MITYSSNGSTYNLNLLIVLRPMTLQAYNLQPTTSSSRGQHSMARPRSITQRGTQSVQNNLAAFRTAPCFMGPKYIRFTGAGSRVFWGSSD